MITDELRHELYQLNNFVTRLLVENVDEQTGNIEDEKVFEFLKNADVQRTDLLTTATISLKHYRDLAGLVASKVRQLNEIKKQYSQFEETLKNILLKFLEPGETLETENFRISWRKSSFVETDLFIDMEKFSEQFPELVNITYNLNKAEIKKIDKTGPLPEGVRITNKMNIQIK